MSIIKIGKQNFEISLLDIKKLVCADLNVPENAVDINYRVENTYDDALGGASYELTKVEVVVDHSITA